MANSINRSQFVQLIDQIDWQLRLSDRWHLSQATSYAQLAIDHLGTDWDTSKIEASIKGKVDDLHQSLTQLANPKLSRDLVSKAINLINSIPFSTDKPSLLDYSKFVAQTKSKNGQIHLKFFGYFPHYEAACLHFNKKSFTPFNHSMHRLDFKMSENEIRDVASKDDQLCFWRGTLSFNTNPLTFDHLVFHIKIGALPVSPGTAEIFLQHQINEPYPKWSITNSSTGKIELSWNPYKWIPSIPYYMADGSKVIYTPFLGNRSPQIFFGTDDSEHLKINFHSNGIDFIPINPLEK